MAEQTIFQPGELVNILIEAALVEQADPETLAVIYPVGDRAHLVELPPSPNMTVTRRAPATWPPRYGDLWRDHDGVLWTVAVRSRRHGDYDHRVHEIECLNTDRVGQYHRIHDAARLLAERGPMELLHREHPAEAGIDDGGEAS